MYLNTETPIRTFTVNGVIVDVFRINTIRKDGVNRSTYAIIDNADGDLDTEFEIVNPTSELITETARKILGI